MPLATDNIQFDRMWINQPSTLQRYHAWHGTNVLVGEREENGYTRVWFTSGLVISMRMDYSALSKGWKH
jgi:hypothetical protein